MANINPKKIPTTAKGIQALAAKEAKKKPVGNSYKDGDASEKIWDNYQITKGLKRDFKKLCKEKKINASKYLRACVRILLDKEGDLKKAGVAVKKVDAPNLAE